MAITVDDFMSMKSAALRIIAEGEHDIQAICRESGVSRTTATRLLDEYRSKKTVDEGVSVVVDTIKKVIKPPQSNYTEHEVFGVKVGLVESSHRLDLQAKSMANGFRSIIVKHKGNLKPKQAFEEYKKLMESDSELPELIESKHRNAYYRIVEEYKSNKIISME